MKFSRVAPTMVANGKGRSEMKNPLSKFYARKNPDDDFDLGGETTTSTPKASAKSAPKASAKSPQKTEEKPAHKRGPGRPPKDPSAHTEPKKKSQFERMTVQQLLEIAKSAGSKSKGKSSEHAPRLQIQWLGNSSGKGGRPAGSKNKPKETSLASNPGGRPKGSKNKPKDPATLVTTKTTGDKKKSHKVGGYSITLLKNPVVDFEIGGVKVLPALAAAGGTIALSQFVKNLPFISDMEDGYVKTVAPAVTVLAGAVAVAHFWSENKLAKEIARDMATFGILLGVSDLAGSWIHSQVDKLRKSETTTPQTTTPQTTTPETTQNGFSGGRFQKLDGGAWKGMSSLDGYVSRNSSSGYPPVMSGSSGYPQPIDRSSELFGSGADGTRTASEISQMNGGRFSSQVPLGGHDMSGFAD